jgi:hypothetical protein
LLDLTYIKQSFGVLIPQIKLFKTNVEDSTILLDLTVKNEAKEKTFFTKLNLSEKAIFFTKNS